LRSGKKEASNENQPQQLGADAKDKRAKRNLSCNENKHRATKKKHNGGEVRDGAMVAQQQRQLLDKTTKIVS
jgi:hypothetical protein